MHQRTEAIRQATAPQTGETYRQMQSHSSPEQKPVCGNRCLGGKSVTGAVREARWVKLQGGSHTSVSAACQSPARLSQGRRRRSPSYFWAGEGKTAFLNYTQTFPFFLTRPALKRKYFTRA